MAAIKTGFHFNISLGSSCGKLLLLPYIGSGGVSACCVALEREKVNSSDRTDERNPIFGPHVDMASINTGGKSPPIILQWFWLYEVLNYLHHYIK